MSARKLFERRKERVRRKLRGNAGRIRLTVYRSKQHIYAQLIDDEQRITVAAASTAEKEVANKLKQATSNITAAKEVGALIAERGKAAKIETVVFDRGGYIYHGRVKALAESAREHGLVF